MLPPFSAAEDVFAHVRITCRRLLSSPAGLEPTVSAAHRSVIAEAVAGDPGTYTEGFLGKSNAEYCAWIRDPQRWGGGIELSILSRCAAMAQDCVVAHHL